MQGAGTGGGRARARLAEIGFGQTRDPAGGGAVELLVGGWIEPEDGAGLSGLFLSVSVAAPDGSCAGRCRSAVDPGAGGSFHASLRLENPPPWWLAGMGEQALHRVEARLEDAEGAVLDEIVRKVGVRTLSCRTRPDGSRVLVCNGVETFARGAEWTGGDADAAPEAAADAAFNAIRLESGSPPPPEEFFDACDAAGIAVLGSAGTGNGDEDGGGWEDGGGDDGDDGSDAASAMLLHPCIPDNPLAEPDDDTGFETVRSVVSWAAPETLEDEVHGALAALNSPEMTARTALRGGPPALAAAVLSSWPMPAGPEGWVWISQMAQAAEVRRRIAAARVAFASGRGGAATGLFWSPMQSPRAGADGSSVDSAGRWKALHYGAARAFAPEAVFAVEEAPGAPPAAFRVVDGPGPGRAAEFAWRLTAMDGETLAAGSSPLGPSGPGAERLPLPDPSPFFARRGRGDLALWLSLRDSDGCTLSRDLALFAPPRALQLQDPDLSLDVSPPEEHDGEQVFRVGVSASAPALCAFVEAPGIPALFEDSFFDLDPDETVELHVATLRRVDEAAFRAAVRVRSLFDLLRPDSGLQMQ